MLKVGLLSDTHGYFDAKMKGFLWNVDEIWHAGDIGTLDLLDQMNNVAPVKAVYGNIDNHSIRQELRITEIFKVENIKVLLTHIGGYPNHYEHQIKQLLLAEKPNLFISGHSHILKVIYDKKLDLLHLNPGAAGKSGFHNVRTMLRFKIIGDQIKDLEIWEHKR